MKIAVLLNTDKLGGAERSLIEQLALVKGVHAFDFFYPGLDGDESALLAFLKSKGFENTFTYSYPGSIYRLSRKNLRKAAASLLWTPALLPYLLRWHRSFNAYDFFYVNGNKAALPLFAWAFFRRKRGLVFWHFRDYPSPTAFRFIQKVVKTFLPKWLRLKLVANSHSVEEKIKEALPGYPVETVYNLPGSLPSKPAPREIRRVGVVAMMAPWKGVHDVLLTIAIYRKELRDLGIEKFSFFGGSIYRTEGEHNDYQSQVMRLAEKLGLDNVEFAGLKKPEEIFSSIDLLIHSSSRPEPFGRVLVEAFKSRTPAISTALGGAGELVQNRSTGLTYRPYDHAGLFHAIKAFCDDNQLVEDITLRAHNLCENIEASLPTSLTRLFIP